MFFVNSVGITIDKTELEDQSTVFLVMFWFV